MEKVILDTNFLMIPFKFKVDIYSELKTILDNPKLFIVDKTIDELNNIQITQKGKNKEYAKMAHLSLKKYPISIIKTVKHLNKEPKLSKITSVDDTIAESAQKGSYFVATQDQALKKKLKNKEIKIITLRQKKYLIKI